MYADQRQYEVYGYIGDSIAYQFSHCVDERHDEEMIEQVRELQAPNHETPTDCLCYADIFYCDAQDVILVGTWVTHSGEAIWHAGGWNERPKASKENALRFLYGLNRPA